MIFFLVGYMGSGKSSIGRVLARRTGYAFVDMDREIERRNGKTISEIFADHGEEYFREQERALIAEIADERFQESADKAGESSSVSEVNETADTDKDKAHNVIVATGGGVPCFGDNMERMKEAGLVVYLRMSPEKLVGRLKFGKARRPKIAHMDDAQLLEFIRKNLEERAPYYEKASMTINCDGVSDDYICRHIEGFIDYSAGRMK